MMKKSAGILLYRFKNSFLQVVLVHPGGPFWAKKDLGVWSIPKGEIEQGEDELDAAKRELLEETGIIAAGKFIRLNEVKQKAGKIIEAWAIQYEADLPEIKSNTFEMEWPPKSGRKQLFPEIDKAEWFSIDIAASKINPGQLSLIVQLAFLVQ